MEKMSRLVLLAVIMMVAGCETVYHRNSVYQYDAAYDTVNNTEDATDSSEDNDTQYCDNRFTC